MLSRRLVVSAAVFVAALASSPVLSGQGSAPVVRAARITDRIDDGRLTALSGSVHPALAGATDLGLVSPDLAMNRMLLVLRRSPELQAAADEFLAEQYDPKSPNFHHWLSADEFGQRFGVADADISVLTAWLGSHGFTVNNVSKGRLTVEFSGTAGQVQSVFHTGIHRYTVSGETHLANASPPQIPVALATVVVGFVSLNDFYAKPQSVIGGTLRRSAGGKLTRDVPKAALANLSSAASPLYTIPVTGGTEDFISPFDFATIYNETPLWTAGVNGSGVSIAIAGRSEIKMSDVATFQSTFGLPNNPPSIIHNGPSPGVLTSSGDQAENTLDVEWSGAAAPGAKVNLVVSSSTNAADGFVLSAQYIIDNQVASIMSSSYGNCELGLGAGGNAFFSSLWQQAAAEGISAFVSSGDQASAGCDDSNANTPYRAIYGLQVNGIASTPYNVAVGGTDFGIAEFSSPTTYFNTTNLANGQSAKGYIPEVPWNDSCGSTVVIYAVGLAGSSPEKVCNLALNSSNDQFLLNVIGGSGGASACTNPSSNTPASCTGGYPKPSWQVAPGVPADGKRDIPDVSLFAAPGLLDGAYVFEYNGSLSFAGGTSISSPAMAGILALVVQKQGAAQGLPNPVFYKLAAAQSAGACVSDSVASGNTCTFYDVVSGNNAPPCAPTSTNCVVSTVGDQVGILSGYTTTSGFDLATGLGTINATNLVSNWASIAGSPTTTITITPTTLPGPSLTAPYSTQVTAGGGVAPYTYTVISGTLPPGLSLSADGLISGVPSLVGVYTFTIAANDSSLNGPFSGSQAYTVTVGAALTPGAIVWPAATDTSYTGLPLGTGVLDATSVLPGSIVYTALLANSSPAMTVTSSTVLAAGSYTLTATFTPTGGTVATASASIPFNVLTEHIWVANTNGSVTALDAGGNLIGGPFPGGGSGIAIDESGTVWSGAPGGTSLSEFDNYVTSGSAAYGAAATGGGISGAAALAADGNGSIWVANSNGSVTQLSNVGVALSPSAGFTGGNMNSPSGIAVDISGNVWVANKGNNSVTEILGAAAPTLPITPAVVVGTPGVKP